jgi:hypothetical protein
MLNERVPVGDGKERDIQILGTYPEYSRVEIWWWFQAILRSAG